MQDRIMSWVTWITGGEQSTRDPRGRKCLIQPEVGNTSLHGFLSGSWRMGGTRGKEQMCRSAATSGDQGDSGWLDAWAPMSQGRSVALYTMRGNWTWSCLGNQEPLEVFNQDSHIASILEIETRGGRRRKGGHLERSATKVTSKSSENPISPTLEPEPPP